MGDAARLATLVVVVGQFGHGAVAATIAWLAVAAVSVPRLGIVAASISRRRRRRGIIAVVAGLAVAVSIARLAVAAAIAVVGLAI